MGNKVIGERIEQRRKQLGLTLDDIAQEIGVAKSTVQRYERGTIETIKLPIIEAIASIMSVNPSWLCGKTDDMTPEKNKYSLDLIKNAPPYSEEALKLAEDYDGRMDDRGRETVRSVADLEVARFKARTAAALRKSREQSEAAEEIAPPITLHQPYAQVAAAEGAGAFLLDDGFDEVLVEMNKYTKQADVILKVVGRSMEPVITDGDRVLVRQQPSVRIGEIGVFIVDGQGYLKEYQADRLVSLNPDIDDVLVGDLQSTECYGKFIKVLNPDWVK